MKVISRFAPSPTGFMHIGNVRTALFAYLWVKKNNGQFILRIEDTDRERLLAGAVDHIKEALDWLGIEWDFGPDKPGPFGSCIQSERLSIYKKYAEELVKKGLAYPDPYTKEQIEEFRKKAESEKRPFIYRHNRPEKFETWDGTKPLRLKTPEIKKYKWHDVVRGDLEAGEDALDDFILIKSDGYPTYNFAHIIDDYEMGITHVFRSDEFISSTPKFLSLYDALEIKPPLFATLPPILRSDRTKKLGKRDGAKDFLEYKKEGYLPEAIFNYLVLLGWHPTDDKEVMSMDEIIAEFTLERIQRAGAVFDDDKLNWFNREYILKLNDEQFTEQAKPYLPAWLDVGSDTFKKTLPLIRDKAKVFSDISGIFGEESELGFIKAIGEYPSNLLLWKKNKDLALTTKHLNYCHEMLSKITDVDFNLDKIKDSIWSYAEKEGKGDVLWPLRVALTGKEKSPDPIIAANILGKAESLKRIKNALEKLK